LIAVTLGIGLGLLLQPGKHTSVTEDAAAAPGAVGDWWAFLTGLIPTNILGLQASTSVEDGSATTNLSFNILQLIVVAVALGIAALKVGEKAEPFLAFNQVALDIVQKVLWWVIRLAPLGTVGLLGYAVADYGWDAIGSLGRFTAAIYIGLALVIGVVYPVLLRLHGLSVRRWFSTVWPATQLAFVSRSSLGTLPVTEQVVERVGVPRGYASFAVPLGATTKMDGCAAIYPALSAIFVAQFFGVSLSLPDYFLIVIVSVLGSAATAGTTGATVMLTLTLSTLGLPLAGVGLLLAVDPILDMGRTAVNVTGQALVPTLVAKREGILDGEQFAHATAVPGDEPIDRPREAQPALA
jgi:Na+/H+-dicarboxylate symporter